MADYSNYYSFKEKLDNHHKWPSLYMFKFIVPKGKEGEIAMLFPGNELKTKESRKGNYVSVTAKVMMSSSEEVIKKYKAAYQVEGVLSL